MLGIIFLSMIPVNIAKITFFSSDILCDGFKRKHNIQILSLNVFCIGNELIFLNAAILMKCLHHIALVFCMNSELFEQ